MAEKITVLAEGGIRADRQAVWDLLTDERSLRRLCETHLGIAVVLEGGTNPYGADRIPLVARVNGTDLLLSAADCSVAIRVLSAGENDSRAIVAASYDAGGRERPAKAQLEQLIAALRAACEGETQRQSAAPHSSRMEQQPQEQAAANTFRVSRLEKTEEQDAVSAGQRGEVFHQQVVSTRSAQKKSAKSNTASAAASASAPKKRTGVVVLALALVALLVAGYLLLPYVRARLAQPEIQPGAPGVTLENMLAIAPGASAAQVKTQFGSEGTRQQDGTLYTGESVLPQSSEPVLVYVEYDVNGAKRLTYLNLAAATEIGAVTLPAAALTPGMTVAEIELALGRPASMVRVFERDGSTIQETHFGYVDPFANFNPAWRGEYVVIEDRTLGTLQTESWQGYDGADPLMIGELGTLPVSNQYSDYTAFLNDRFVFGRAMLMLERYSIGDMRRAFGEIELYSTDGGVALYAHDAEELLEDGATPRYRYSFGFDSRGSFVMSSFVNMYLFNRQDQLKASRYKDVTRGMSYGEVRALMGVLPTAVFVDRECFTVCYGRHLSSDNIEEQFEFIVRFDIATGYAQIYWDNSGFAQATQGQQ